MPFQAFGPTTYLPINQRIYHLVNDSTTYETKDLVGSRGHIRGGYVDLSVALPSLPDQSKLRDVEVYADTLDITAPITLPALDSLVIFARRITVKDDVIIKVSREFLLQIYCSNSSLPLKLHVGTPDRVQIVEIKKLAAQSMSINLDIVKEGGKWHVNSEEDPTSLSSYLNVPDIIERIADNGSLASIGSDKMNINLPSLLRYQLLLASSWQQRYPEDAFDAATYVAKMTQRVPKAFGLYSRALTMASTKVASSNSEASTQISSKVPLLDVSSTKQIMKARLTSAIAFENAFQNFTAQQANAANVKLFATVALQASQDADNRYKFLTSLSAKRFQSAKDSLVKAQSNFKLLYDEMPAKQKAFKDGIEEWRQKQIRDAVVKGVIALVTIVASIAIACVAPPAAAGVAAGAAEVGEVAKAAAGTAKNISQIAKILETLKNLYEKLKPALEKIGEIIGTVTEMIELVEKIKSAGSTSSEENKEISNLKMPVAQGDDMINLQADWDVFATEMNNVYEPIKSEGIAGAGEFFELVSKMVIRGKAVLAAQQAVSSAGDDYMATLTQQINSERQTARLTAAIDQSIGDPVALQYIKLLLFERLLAIRTWILIDMKQYLDAYNWYTLENLEENLVTLDPLKDIGSFANDAANLQAAYSQASARLRNQRRSFIYSTSALQYGTDQRVASASTPAYLATTGDFLTALKKSGSASFSLSPLHEAFVGIGRVRLISFGVYLEQQSSDKQTYVELKVSLGEGMQDLLPMEPDRTMMGAGDATATFLMNSARVLSFVTSATTLGFAYESSPSAVTNGDSSKRDVLDQKVLLQGLTSSGGGRPSPFRTWTIEVNRRLDVSKVTGVLVRLDCEVTVLE